MIETTEAGAGSYPTPPFTRTKLYKFTCNCSCKAMFYVYAKDTEEAFDLLDSKEYIDSNIIGDLVIEEVKNSEIEEFN